MSSFLQYDQVINSDLLSHLAYLVRHLKESDLTEAQKVVLSRHYDRTKSDNDDQVVIRSVN